MSSDDTKYYGGELYSVVGSREPRSGSMTLCSQDAFTLTPLDQRCRLKDRHVLPP
jgi:hypothetical protein